MPNILTMVCESFGFSRRVALGLVTLVGVMLAGALYFFIHSAPPDNITIITGPEGSVFYSNAVKYAAILKREGVKLNILTSQGSLDNLKKLDDASIKVDVGFVQGGITNAGTSKLASLGSISYQPLLVFYRGAPVVTLADLAGRRLAVGPVGSGTRNLVLTLLATNGITTKGTTNLLDWDAKQAAQALQEGRVDAVFLMGEDASVTILRQLLLAPDIQLMNFAQADAYTRRYGYLRMLKMPEGVLDLGKNVPAHDIYLIGPTVELIARENLHPALSDLLLEAAQEVHGNVGTFQHKGEFPAQMGDDFPISDNAVRFYKSGSKFFYRYLPFWLASMTSRILIVFVPMIVILVPIIRSIPHLYRWRSQARIYRWYRALLVVEREMFNESDAKKRQQMHKRLDEIEREVNKLKVPAFLANQFYSLREDIAQVRELMAKPVK